MDECFADLTGLRRPLRMSYLQIAERIKHDLDTELGFTFSVGLAPNKVVAKIASKWAEAVGSDRHSRPGAPPLPGATPRGTRLGHRPSDHRLAP